MQNPFVDKLRAFGHLKDADVAALEAATSRPRKIAGRRDLIREGDRPGSIFVIIEGWACRYKILPNGARQVLAFLMPGDSCDLHVSLLAEMDHSIQTITPSLVATIDREQLNSLIDKHPAIGKCMYLVQLVDGGTMRAWITSMGRRTSVERVSHLMCELYIRAHAVGLASEPQVRLPLSQLLLADSLGMTPVHLNRVLKKLRLSGAMSFYRGNLMINEPAKLVRIAGFDENYLHRRLRETV